MHQAKQAEAAANGAPKKAAAAGEADMDDLDPNQYFQLRVKAVQAAKAGGGNPYPHKFEVSHSLQQFVDAFSGLGDGTRGEEQVSVAGTCPAHATPALHSPTCSTPAAAQLCVSKLLPADGAGRAGLQAGCT